MPTFSEVKSMIRAGESDSVEFKKRINHPEKVAREIVAFANTSGGHLFVGVEDNGHIEGLKHPEDDIFVLNRILDEKCKPKIRYSVETYPLPEKRTLVAYVIPESKRKPHYLNVNGGLGKAFIRISDKSIQASREVREILKRRRKRKDLGFTLGDKEQELFKYLGEHGFINLEDTAKLLKIPIVSASKKLVLLVLVNVLEIKPGEKEDLFYMKTP